jgi:hypothetical protein
MLTGGGSHLISLAAMGILSTVAALAILTAFAHRFKCEEMITKTPIFAIIYSLVGLLVAGLLTFYEVFTLRDLVLDCLLVLLGAVLFFAGRQLFTLLTELLPLRDQDLVLMFPRFPPTERSDLFRVDALLILILLMPFLAKFFHH